ncbi:MAG TPA: hypothetical protein VF557_13535 [Jatrophihabitans sp.]|uniref:hypothetical protein n=1 Tax=Jatrophihabitans sp. TaxID=1932789 RepID=UPI002F154E35
MSLRTSIAGVAVATLAVGLTVAVSPLTASPAAAAEISCSTAASSGSGPFYPGPDASIAYDRAFSRSFPLPGLDTHIPQGVATWRNWDGKGHNMFLMASYHPGQNARIYGIAPGGGLVGTVEIADTHAGGIAVVGNWIYVQHTSTSIRKYRTSDIRRGMNHRRGYLYVASVGTPRTVYGASFMTASGNYLFSGKFNEDDRDRMYAYRVNRNGSLTTLRNGGYEVPKKTQGVAVLGDRFLFSTSYGRGDRGNIYVVKRGYSSLDTARLRCFRAPSMNEGMTIYGNYVYVVFEGGSYEYRSDSQNPITHAHRGDLSKLRI